MELVIVARYSFSSEVYIAKANLESAGIPAFISDEHTVQMDWLYSNLLGGIKLWVVEEQLEEAKKILATDYTVALENELELDEVLPASSITPAYAKKIRGCSRLGF